MTVASRVKVHVKKGDTVEVIAGKDKGKRGKVLTVNPTTSRVTVESINIVKRHTKPDQTNPQGGVMEKEAPIHSSNLIIVCKNCKSRTRMGRKFLDDGNKARYCKSCGEVLD